MTYETLLTERHDRVLLIRLNRPQALNALNAQVARDLIAVTSAADQDDSIGCLVLTGSEKAFAAGADVYVTGDPKYHQAQAVPPGKCILDVGHFSLEEVMMRRFAADLAGSLGPNGPAMRFFPGNDPFSAYVPQGASPRGTE